MPASLTCWERLAKSDGLCPLLQVSYAQSPLEAKEYNLALARTRQAMAVHRAVQYMNFGSPARYARGAQCCIGAAVVFKNINKTLTRDFWCRALVELQRALQENSTARCPVLSAQYDGKDVSALPRCHSQAYQESESLASG